MILDQGIDYGLLPSNPAIGRRRRLKTTRPARPWIEPQQLMAFLNGADGVGRVLLGILVGTGLRIEEALSLTWADVDLGSGHLYVRKAKTPKGVRRIPLSPALREELALWRDETRHSAPADFVVHTSTGAEAQPVEPPPRRARLGREGS
jgi:integrase